MKPRVLGALCLVGLLLTIVAANATLKRFGLWHIGPFFIASGAVWAGVAFTLRDGVHEWLGARWVWLAIVLGAVLSGLVDPALALASGAAFAISETADFFVYTPLRERGRLRAVFASNLVGSVLDSWVFLWLAPFPATANAVLGLVLAKVVVTLVTVTLLSLIRDWRQTLAVAVGAAFVGYVGATMWQVSQEHSEDRRRAYQRCLHEHPERPDLYCEWDG